MRVNSQSQIYQADIINVIIVTIINTFGMFFLKNEIELNRYSNIISCNSYCILNSVLQGTVYHNSIDISILMSYYVKFCQRRIDILYA